MYVTRCCFWSFWDWMWSLVQVILITRRYDIPVRGTNVWKKAGHTTMPRVSFNPDALRVLFKIPWATSVGTVGSSVMCRSSKIKCQVDLCDGLCKTVCYACAIVRRSWKRIPTMLQPSVAEREKTSVLSVCILGWQIFSLSLALPCSLAVSPLSITAIMGNCEIMYKEEGW